MFEIYVHKEKKEAGSQSIHNLLCVDCDPVSFFSFPYIHIFSFILVVLEPVNWPGDMLH